MIVIITVAEVLQDNYQGGSGLPIKRSFSINIPDDTRISDVEEFVRRKQKGNNLNSVWGNCFENNAYITILKIEILPLIK